MPHAVGWITGNAFSLFIILHHQLQWFFFGMEGPWVPGLTWGVLQKNSTTFLDN